MSVASFNGLFLYLGGSVGANEIIFYIESGQIGSSFFPFSDWLSWKEQQIKVIHAYENECANRNAYCSLRARVMSRGSDGRQDHDTVRLLSLGLFERHMKPRSISNSARAKGRGNLAHSWHKTWITPQRGWKFARIWILVDILFPTEYNHDKIIVIVKGNDDNFLDKWNLTNFYKGWGTFNQPVVKSIPNLNEFNGCSGSFPFFFNRVKNNRKSSKILQDLQGRRFWLCFLG